MTLIRRMILAFALLAGAYPAFGQVPPQVPALPDTERRTTYSITGTTCACAVGFQLYGDSTDYTNWVEVFLNGVLIPQSGNWTITSPTGSLATIPRPITDAVLTFTAVQTGTVQIVGARRPRRTSQFQESQPVPTRNFNVVVSDLTAQNREVWDKINDVTGRAVRAPPGETLNLLPILANRANQGACFDAGGNLTNCVSVPSSTFTAGNGITLTGTNPTTITNNISAGTGIAVTPGNPTIVSILTSAFMSVLNAACTLSPSTCNFFFGYYSPQWFGALGNGTGDDGPAINAAIAMAGTLTVQFSGATYRHSTPIVIAKPGVTLQGAGRQNTILDFEPAGGATGVKCNGAGGEITQFGIRDLSIASSDTTNAKVGINLVDCSQVQIRNVEITRLGGGIMTGGAGSICLQTNGRDLSIFEDLVLGCDFPIVLAADPSVASLATDHYIFRDLYLVGSALGPCILANQGIVMTNTTFEGRQSWTRCAGGFQTNDTTSAFAWNNLSFSNVRYEQDQGGGLKPVFAILPNNSLLNLTIRNSDFGPRGIQLRKVFGALIADSESTCAVSNVFLDVDTTSDQIELRNNVVGSTCTISLGGMTPMFTASNPGGGTVPISAHYFASATSALFFFKMIGTTPLTVATLPVCGAATKGMRAAITDSNVTFTAGIGAGLSSGGANVVPVFCDGSIWRLG